jgi:hypothetical protein
MPRRNDSEIGLVWCGVRLWCFSLLVMLQEVSEFVLVVVLLLDGAYAADLMVDCRSIDF